MTKLRYQLIIFSPKNKARKVPVTKNGAKGTSDLKVFLLRTIRINPTTAPIKKAKKRATKIFGQPRKRPIRKANFISPTPIHLPREIRTIVRKKAAAPKADRKLLIVDC